MAEQERTPVPGPENDSRIVHYAFAYQMMPMLVFSKHNDAIWEQMRQPEARQATLYDAWLRTCRHFDVKDFAPVGLQGDFIETERKEYLVIRMPEPIKSPEAFRCVVEKSLETGNYRYFSAEFSAGLQDEEAVVLGEWVAPMNRRNLGSLPSADADEMLVAIAGLSVVDQS